MPYSPSLKVLAQFGLFFTDSGTGLLREHYLVYETANKEYKLIWWDGRTGCLSKKLAEPGPPNKNWFNQRPTDEVLGYPTSKCDLDLYSFLLQHLPVANKYAQAFDHDFDFLHARIADQSDHLASEGRNKLAKLARAGLAWSADVDWLLRRVLKMREQQYIGPEVCIWAITAAARNSARDPRGERDTIVADVTWHEHLNHYHFKANPISGQFRVSDFSARMRLVAVIDRRPSL